MRKFLFYTISISYILGSCSLDFTPEDQVSDPDAITSVTTAQRALAASYKSYSEYAYALDIVLLSDDLEPTPLLTKNSNLRNTYLWDEKAILALSETIWQDLYNTIAQVNVLLERLPNISKNTNLKTLKEIEAQACYLKGLCYFQLLRFFSPINNLKKETCGLLLKNNFDLTTQQQRVSIIESVKEIDKLLSYKSENNNILWLTNDTAKYLQAELALWVNDYQKALDIALPLYQKYLAILESTKTDDIWSNNNSNLRLFSLDLQSVNTQLYAGLQYHQEIGDYLKVNTNIIYNEDDIRYNNYTLAFTMNIDSEQINGFYLGKYNHQTKAGKTTNYYTKLRVAGLTFICAEAYLKNNQTEETIALLNQFLTSRHSPKISTKINNKKELLNIILTEKQKEFVGEPERFFDLKRNHKNIIKYTATSTYNISYNDYRWTLPIPKSETKYNRLIAQNKGWEHLGTAN